MTLALSTTDHILWEIDQLAFATNDLWTLFRWVDFKLRFFQLPRTLQLRIHRLRFAGKLHVVLILLKKLPCYAAPPYTVRGVALTWQMISSRSAGCGQ